MINQISWGSFLIYTGGALLVYYLVIIVVQGSGWKVKIGNAKGLPPLLGLGKITDNSGNADSQLLMPIVHDAVDEIQSYLAAVEKDIAKEDLLCGLKKLLAKYPTLKGSEFQTGISNLIAVTCVNNCSQDLSETDLKEIWE